MLKVASFEISDAAGINKLLETNRLASGAHILVSEGKVLIPYEDGELENTAQQIIAIKEQKNTMLKEEGIISHSQLVLERMIQLLQDQLSGFEADLAEAKAKKANKGDIQSMIQMARNQISQKKTQYAMNQNEMARITINLEVYDKQIEALNGQAN